MFACLFVTQSRSVITEMILLNFGNEIITASIDKIIRLNILDATDHVKELIQFNQYVLALNHRLYLSTSSDTIYQLYKDCR